MNRQLAEQLAERLTRPLTGAASRFEPRPALGRQYDRIPSGARQAAVLVLLYPHENAWHIPLTLRHAQLAAHAGQISLPGGAIEPGETSALAAVRELHEELGAKDQPIELLGRLSPIYVAVSNFRVEPWVGAAPTQPVLVPCEAEVEAVLEVPLAALLDPANFGRHERTYQGQAYLAPHFAWQSHCIWGATCRILGELVTLLEESQIDA